MNISGSSINFERGQLHQACAAWLDAKQHGAADDVLEHLWCEIERLTGNLTQCHTRDLPHAWRETFARTIYLCCAGYNPMVRS